MGSYITYHLRARHCVLTQNMLLSTLPQDVLIFRNIRFTAYDEEVRISAPYTRDQKKIKNSLKIINNKIVETNKNERYPKSQYSKLLLETCNGNPCENRGYCFHIGKNKSIKHCACRMHPAMGKLLWYYGPRCRKFMYKDPVDSRTEVAANDPFHYWHLKDIEDGLLNFIPRLKNKKLHFQLSKKIPGVKQEYKSLTSIIDKITWLPKTVNLYLIKKDIPNNKHHTEFIAELRAKLLAKVKRKIEINAHFVCEVEWELDEDAFDSIC